MTSWTLRCIGVAVSLLVACGESGSKPASSGAGGASDAATGDAGAPVTGADTCDLSGAWVIHRVSFANADTPLVTGAQKSTRWYYAEVAQTEDDVTFTRGLWCGDRTTGGATVSYSEDGFQTLIPLASTDGRRGTYTRAGDGCALSLERIYWVFGVEDPAHFLEGVEAPPGRIAGDPELDTLAPLPTTPDDAAIADSDGDGNPGVRSLLVESPVGSGVRHGLQRGWEEIAGDSPRGATDFRVPVAYGFQEVALQATPEVFKTNASVRDGSPHEARFRRVAADFAGPTDVDTCDAVRELTPHRPEPREAY